MYIKCNDRHCQKIMQERINKGHSKVYPDKPMYFEGFDPYGNFFTTIFLIKICCVYFPLSNEYKDLAPEKFDELLKIYRNSEHAIKSEAKKLKNHGFSVYNYGDSNELEVLIDDLHIDITARDYSANQLSDLIYDALDTLSQFSPKSLQVFSLKVKLRQNFPKNWAVRSLLSLIRRTGLSNSLPSTLRTMGMKLRTLSCRLGSAVTDSKRLADIMSVSLTVA